MSNKLVQIQLISPAKGLLDVKEGTSIPLTFNVADIRDISKRKGTTSKSIKLVGSKNNNKLLNNYFDTNIVANTFDVNKLQLCNVLEDGIPILNNAYLQLISIDKIQSTSNIESNVEYTVLVKDNVSNFFTNISGKFLDELEFGEYNHKFNATNIVGAINNTWEDGYKYPFFYNNDDTTYELKQFAPAIFAKTYFDKIFNGAGFVYDWSTISASTVQFDKLIIPYNGDTLKISAEETEQYNVDARITADTTYTTTQLIGQSNSFKVPIIPNVEISDEENRYDPITGVYTNQFEVPRGELLNISFEVEYDLVMVNSSGGVAYVVNETSSNPNVNVGWDITPEMAVYVNGITNNTSYRFEANMGDAVVFRSDSNYGTQSIPAGDTVIQSNKRVVVLSKTNLNINDTLTFKIGVDVARNTTIATPMWSTISTIGGSPAQVDIEVRVKNVKMLIEPTISTNQYDTNINLNNFVPKKIKQSDFIASVLSMYNLFATIDPDNENKLILTHRDDYYDNGDTVDLTNKQYKDKNQEITLLPDLSKKKIIISYKNDDKDELLASYKDGTNETYGQIEYTFDSDYVSDVETKEMLFSPIIPIQDINGNTLPISSSAPKSNIKIALNAQTLSAATPITITNYVGSSATTTEYPLVHHWDSPENASFDLNFGICDFYAYPNTGSFTNNNLFNLHWRRTINQINKGKMLTSYFNLDAVDIANIKLNSIVEINNTVWTINKIIDYKAGTNEPTKVELLSIDDSIKLVPFIKKAPFRPHIGSGILNPRIYTGNINGGYINFGNTPLTNDPIIYVGRDNIAGQSAGSSILAGSRNTVTQKATVFGNNNTVFGKDAMVVGNSNIVESGVQNALIFGNNITATTSNTAYVNNIDISESITVASGATIDMSGGTLINSAVPVTYSEITTLMSTDEIYSGTTYYIVDRGIYVDGMSKNTVSVNGKRIMKVVPNSRYTPNTVAGSPNLVYGGIYGQTINKGSYPNSDGTNIYIVIWGGRLWQRDTSGADVDSGLQNTMGTGWIMIPTTDSRYEDSVFNIIYDIDNDWIVKQGDIRGNVFGVKYDGGLTFNPVDISDWGNEDIFHNECDGVFNNTVSVYDNTNIGAIYDNNNGGDIYDNSNKGDIYDNTNNGVINGNINTGNINNNSNGSYISKNTNAGNIELNSNGIDVSENSNTGNIYGNSNTVSIRNNSNVGDILSNTNTGYIYRNSNGGTINSNSNVSNIDSNSNTGNITSNSNLSQISRNTNLGNINNNSNNSSIVENSNLGNIDGNTNTGYIYRNSNLGVINSNSNNGYIYRNNNSGNIITNTNSGNILYNSCNGDITTNSNNGVIGYNDNLDNISNNSNGGDITQNDNAGSIFSNTNTSYIYRNSNNGNIGANSISGLITYNTNNGDINSNGSNVLQIARNSNDGLINSNTNNGQINDNYNRGNINNNTNTSYIVENGNNGAIVVNQHNGFIQGNTNRGSINDNRITGNIGNNSNNGQINSNNRLGNILNNKNKGSINSNAGQGWIYDNMNVGDISLNAGTTAIYQNSNNGNINENVVTGGGIFENSNNGEIRENNLTSGLYQNSNNGNIIGNDLTNIKYNNNDGNINSNDLVNAIDYNNNGGDIINNTINGPIQRNSNKGVINANIANGPITNNSNSGSIFGNNMNEISFNQNNGAIDSNTQTGNQLYILNNQNNGLISRNNATANIYISSNINNGNIGNAFFSTNRGANISDTIVNK